jgi:hypothetical protein
VLTTTRQARLSFSTQQLVESFHGGHAIVVTSQASGIKTVEWWETRRPLMGRVAGALWVAGLIPGFVDPGHVYDKLFINLSTSQIVDWAAHNGTGISVTAFVGTFQWTLWAIATVLTVSFLRGRGVPAAVGYISVASGMAVSWVAAGSMFALVETAQQAGSDAGVVALFQFAHAMAGTDGLFGAGMVASISILIWSTDLLPAPIAWLGGLNALYHAGTGLAVQLLLTGTIYGITGPLSLLFSIPWFLAIGITLMIRPIWESSSLVGPQTARA